jgi:hypothetical protein
MDRHFWGSTQVGEHRLEAGVILSKEASNGSGHGVVLLAT